ncbi:MAG: acyl carrier protein [Pantanalinema sp. GBBB05]|nr:acyl carrier protein [Pantanalinema sp. GBBB05]
METLTAILIDLGIPATALQEDTLLHGHLGLDSVETVKLALELKRRLDIDMPLGTRNDMSLAEICQRVEVALSTQSSGC